MTAQTTEILIYKGKKYGMATEPLEPYIRKNNIKFNTSCVLSCCWRGYVGTWSIEGNRLYLIGLDTDDNGKKVGLEYLFPGHEKVFADWFSGELRIPYGNLMKYVHQGYASLYEKELFLKIDNGIVTNEREIDNTQYYNAPKGMEKRNTDDIIKAVLGDNMKSTERKKPSKFRRWIDSLLKNS